MAMTHDNRQREHGSAGAIGRMRPKGRAMAAFMVAVGLMLVILFRGYVVWKVLPAPWLGAFFIAFGTLAFIRPAILKRG